MHLHFGRVESNGGGDRELVTAVVLPRAPLVEDHTDRKHSALVPTALERRHRRMPLFRAAVLRNRWHVATHARTEQGKRNAKKESKGSATIE